MCDQSPQPCDYEYNSDASLRWLPLVCVESAHQTRLLHNKMQILPTPTLQPPPVHTSSTQPKSSSSSLLCISATRIRDVLPDLPLVGTGGFSSVFACFFVGQRAVVKVLNDGTDWGEAYPINPAQHLVVKDSVDWITHCDCIYDLRAFGRAHNRWSAGGANLPPLVWAMRHEAHMAAAIQTASVACIQPVGYGFFLDGVCVHVCAGRMCCQPLPHRYGWTRVGQTYFAFLVYPYASQGSLDVQRQRVLAAKWVFWRGCCCWGWQQQ